MLLHLIKAHPKFPPLIRNLFEEIMPGEHCYVLVGDCDRLPQLWDGFHVLGQQEDLRGIIRGMGSIDGIILNGLLELAVPLLPLFPEDVPVAWVIWGSEFYEHVYNGNQELFGGLTRRYLNRDPIARLRNRLRPLYWNLCGRSRRRRQVLRRLSYVVTQLPAEYDLLKRKAGEPLPCDHVEVPVIQLRDLIGSGSAQRPLAGSNIQVGNSADPTNNHLEVFEILGRCDMTGRKVMVPLSYGKPDYRRYIVEEGRRRLGDFFAPITDFLPLDSYLASVDSCSIVIMNHFRQQGLGNIIAALWRGARVYLGPSTTYTTYRDWGLSVFPLEESFSLPDVSIAEIDRNATRNRKILQKHMGAEVVRSRVSAWLWEMKKQKKLDDGRTSFL